MRQKLVPLAEDVNRIAVRGVRRAQVAATRAVLLAIIENLAARRAGRQHAHAVDPRLVGGRKTAAAAGAPRAQALKRARVYRRFFLAARLAGFAAFAFAGAALRGGMIGSSTKFSRPPPRCSVVLPP